jgi:hypothetical protein
VITIRGISINGFCNGIRGINVISAKAVNIEDCVIFRFANEGILINDANGVAVDIRNSVIRDNTTEGISLASASSQAKINLDNVRVSGNGGNGVRVLAGGRLVDHNCLFSHNAASSVLADTVGAGTVAHARIRTSRLAEYPRA